MCSGGECVSICVFLDLFGAWIARFLGLEFFLVGVPVWGLQGSAGGRGAGGRKIVKKCKFSKFPK